MNSTDMAYESYEEWREEAVIAMLVVLNMIWVEIAVRFRDTEPVLHFKKDLPMGWRQAALRFVEAWAETFYRGISIIELAKEHINESRWVHWSNLKCPACGRSVIVAESLERAYCDDCGETFDIEVKVRIAGD